MVYAQVHINIGLNHKVSQSIYDDIVHSIPHQE